MATCHGKTVSSLHRERPAFHHPPKIEGCRWAFPLSILFFFFFRKKYASYDLTVCVGHLTLSNTPRHAVIFPASDLFPCSPFPLRPSVCRLNFTQVFSAITSNLQAFAEVLILFKNLKKLCVYLPQKEESSSNRDGPLWHTWGRRVCGLPFAFCWERRSSWEGKSQTGWNLLFRYLILLSVEGKDQNVETKLRKRAAEGGWRYFVHVITHLAVVLLIRAVIKTSIKTQQGERLRHGFDRSEQSERIQQKVFTGVWLTSLYCWHSLRRIRWRLGLEF